MLEVMLLYGSETGNAHYLAKELESRLTSAGHRVTFAAMDDMDRQHLPRVSYLIIITSTYGEGEPPDNALLFFDYLMGTQAPRLEETHYAVLGLGDLAYDNFCETAKNLDSRLEELGAVRIFPRTDCDVDFDTVFEDWVPKILAELKPHTSGTISIIPPSHDPEAMAGSEPAIRTPPFFSRIIDNVNLNGPSSTKITRHMTLSLPDSDLAFEPGDLVGIYPKNDTVLVEALITALHWDANSLVDIGSRQSSLKEALRELEITVITRPLLEKLTPFADPALTDLLRPERAAELKEYMRGRDLLDVVLDFPFHDAMATQIIPLLRAIPPRLYSIASSVLAFPGEVHLALRHVQYRAHGRERQGVCTTYCLREAAPGEHIAIFIKRNPQFKLPADPAAPLILIGPGTGVAPFRAFLQHRQQTGSTGKTWLFYGDRHLKTDFLYRADWLKWLKDGVLSRLDWAFSRDGDQKVYVQHRMAQHSRDLYAWLENGAYVYVCGDEKRMAPDVDAELRAIVAQAGGYQPEQVASYMENLQRQGRYVRDVY